ncbi:hypothetical protein B5X24_HaOG207095 [Helicoverpa armigera]|uniref:Uncharacterized protein n=1 Tax=Helicoverpa armigera TaxID=29058 RepID=A0A2W1BKM7_HELAM|nr:hypothetical protein B5X24_HaOG207095 [Helicoverpa armigera]
MKELKSIYINKKMRNELIHFKENQNPESCHGNDNVSTIVNKIKLNKENKRKMNVHKPLPTVIYRMSSSRISKYNMQAGKHFSAPQFHKRRRSGLITNSYVAIPKRKKSSSSKNIVNLVLKIILRELLLAKKPLPEGKTPSEKALIQVVRAELGLPPEPKTASETANMRKAELAGIITPLEGKSPEEKEKVFKSLTAAGIPLPDGRTLSEKKLVEKVKADAAMPVGMPSEKNKKTRAKDLVTPLAGKSLELKETNSDRIYIDNVRAQFGLPPKPTTPELKGSYATLGLLEPLVEKMLQGLHSLGILIPEVRTAPEKSFICKIAKSAQKVSLTDKQRLELSSRPGTPLEEKALTQKEKIIKRLALQGTSLPEGKTSFEKKLIDMILVELGVHSELKAQALRDKYDKAPHAGSFQPLETKTSKEKKNKRLTDKGISIPKIEGKPAPSITTVKIKKAKAAGFLTHLTGKCLEQKENILKGLPKTGLPLPQGRTPSEKVLITKIRNELKRPDSGPEKQYCVKAGSLLMPLQVKTRVQKDKNLRGRSAAGKPLLIGKSPSDTALIQKIKDDTGYMTPPPSDMYLRMAEAADLITPVKQKSRSMKEEISKDMLTQIPKDNTPSEKDIIKILRAEYPKTTQKQKRARAANTWTTLQGKTPEQKRKILKTLIKSRLPLPEPTTESEKDLIDQIRKGTGLHTEPKTISTKKYKKAQAADILQRLYHDAGIPLPKGQKPSEESMIGKIQAEPAQKTISERSKTEKESALSSPHERKILAQKEKMRIAKDEGDTNGPKKTNSEKFKSAKAEGLLSPLARKILDEKEKVITELVKHDLYIPEVKTASDKKIASKVSKIRKELSLSPEPQNLLMKKSHKNATTCLSPPVKGDVLKSQACMGISLAEGKTPSEKALIAKAKAKTQRPKGTNSEKNKGAKTADLLSPFAGKIAEKKKNCNRGLAEHDLPLPEAKTPSGKKSSSKIRKELGLSPGSKSPPMKERLPKAAANGLSSPLESLSVAEKKRIVTARTDYGMILDERRIVSEKLSAKISPEKLKKAKAAGLLTPLEGKTLAHKERILRGLAEARLPLPDGKTYFEKSLINKVRTELGLPPLAKTPSEVALILKAKADGLFTPLTGKTSAQKEKILQGLAAAGMPLPLGKTPSEKKVLKKIRVVAGLPPFPTPSERLGMIRKKDKRLVVTSGKLGKDNGISDEEFKETIHIKTTCDRGCGCDKKKIRFKDSFVRIRGSTPNNSYTCPCPEKRIPGVKRRSYVDNVGARVTLESADIHSKHSKIEKYNESKMKPVQIKKEEKMRSNKYKMQNHKMYDINDDIGCTLNTTSSDESLNIVSAIGTPYIDSENDLHYYSPPYERWACESKRFVDPTCIFCDPLSKLCNEPVSKNYMVADNPYHGSPYSIFVVKSERSVSLTKSSSESMDTISVMSYASSSVSSNSEHYFDYQLSNELFSNSSFETSDCSANSLSYDVDGTLRSD